MRWLRALLEPVDKNRAFVQAILLIAKVAIIYGLTRDRKKRLMSGLRVKIGTPLAVDQCFAHFLTACCDHREECHIG